MRNNALVFFGGIATAAALQFVTQREWRVNPVSVARADDADSSDRRSDEGPAHSRRSMRAADDGPVRERDRAARFGRRDDERNDERQVGWNEDGRNEDRNQERMSQRRDFNERDGRPEWRNAAEERSGRRAAWREGDDRREMPGEGPMMADDNLGPERGLARSGS